MGEFRMPSLGADMTEGTLVEWLVKPGDAVVKGQPVAVVDTAKSAIEVECFEDGVVEQLLAQPDETVPVGTPLAVIGADGADGADGAARRPEKKPARGAGKPRRAPARKAVSAPPAPTATPLVRRLAREHGVDLAGLRGTGVGGRITRTDMEAAEHETHRVLATPYARRTAAELGVDLTTVAGSGVGGAIRVRDVRAAQEAVSPPATASRAEAGTAPEPQDRGPAMRQAIAALMSRAKREIPHYYLSTTIDMSEVMTWMHEHNRHVPISERLVPAAFLLKAAAVAAREVPEMNGFWLADGHVPSPAVHLGVAVSLRGGGLVAPALHDADTLALTELMTGLRDLVGRARAGRLRGSETADPTITVTNLGEQGVEAVFGVIYPPQVALVGFGKVVDQPRAVDGLLGVRPCVTATLSADHRASDGAVGARYLSTVDRLLQKPEDLQ